MDSPSLDSLEYSPYLDDAGDLPVTLQGKIGVYAIFDREKNLQFVGYSRDIYLSIKQHLARQPRLCYWLKSYTVDRPSRTLLEEIRRNWLAKKGSIDSDETRWTEPIDARRSMTDEEKGSYEKADDIERVKILKSIARRVENEVLEELQQRGSKVEIRFNPKLKEQGLLDLK